MHSVETVSPILPVLNVLYFYQKIVADLIFTAALNESGKTCTQSRRAEASKRTSVHDEKMNDLCGLLKLT